MTQLAVKHHQMNKPYTYHFLEHNNPTRYNLICRLNQHGFKQSDTAKRAHFNDTHLTLDPKGTQQLEYKHRLALLAEKHFPTLMPLTYVIDDHNCLSVLEYITEKHYIRKGKSVEAHAQLQWILKPSMLNNGDHIVLFPSISAVWDHYAIGKRLGGPHVLQQYISHPALLKQCKFTFRLYVIATNYDGVFIYKNGYLNQSLHPYQPHVTCAHHLSVHLTNEHLGQAENNVRQIPSQDYPGFDQLYQHSAAIIKTTIEALVNEAPSFLQQQARRSFEIFGYDFLLDDKGKVWLLEINQAPCFPTTAPHVLTQPLFDPFWQALTENFILPIAKETPLKAISNKNFIRVCTAPTRTLNLTRRIIKHIRGVLKKNQEHKQA